MGYGQSNYVPLDDPNMSFSQGPPMNNANSNMNFPQNNVQPNSNHNSMADIAARNLALNNAELSNGYVNQ